MLKNHQRPDNPKLLIIKNFEKLTRKKFPLQTVTAKLFDTTEMENSPRVKTTVKENWRTSLLAWEWERCAQTCPALAGDIPLFKDCTHVYLVYTHTHIHTNARAFTAASARDANAVLVALGTQRESQIELAACFPRALSPRSFPLPLFPHFESFHGEVSLNTPHLLERRRWADQSTGWKIEHRRGNSPSFKKWWNAPAWGVGKKVLWRGSETRSSSFFFPCCPVNLVL